MRLCVCVIVCFAICVGQVPVGARRSRNGRAEYSWFNYPSTSGTRPPTTGFYEDLDSSNRHRKVTADKLQVKNKREDVVPQPKAQDNFIEPPVFLRLAMSNVTDILELIEKFDINLKNSSIPKAQLSSFLRERNLSPMAAPATCSPQPTTVPIVMDRYNPYDIYFPSCTRMDRCGGCCSHDLLECAPSRSETVELQVLKTRYLGPPQSRFDPGEIVTVELEKHLECQCQCRVKASDCRFGIQVYRPNECRCECINQEEVKYCVGDRIWDPSTCSCRCRDYFECSTGFNFNPDTCTCQAGRTGRFGFGPGFRSF